MVDITWKVPLDVGRIDGSPAVHKTKDLARATFELHGHGLEDLPDLLGSAGNRGEVRVALQDSLEITFTANGMENRWLGRWR